jgi:hypothetical protein
MLNITAVVKAYATSNVSLARAVVRCGATVKLYLSQNVTAAMLHTLPHCHIVHAIQREKFTAMCSESHIKKVIKLNTLF